MFFALRAFALCCFLDGCERYHVITVQLRKTIIDDMFIQTRAALHELKSIVQIPRSVSHLPFKIGAIGYLSYDLGRHYFPLKAHKPKTISRFLRWSWGYTIGV